jgi:hypothetical protein
MPVEAQQYSLLDSLAAVEISEGFILPTDSGQATNIINGLEATDTTNGLGNLIVGYNELRPLSDNVRTGSHNVVVGRQNNFSSFGGLVAGAFNEISGEFAAISGGRFNSAIGDSPQSAGEARTRPVAFSPPRSAAEPTGLRQVRSTGRLAPSSPRSKAWHTMGGHKKPGPSTKGGAEHEPAPHCFSTFAIFSSSRLNL